MVRFDLPGGTPAIGPTLAATARAAEDGGVAVFSLMDHWFQMDYMAPATDPMLEGYTSLCSSDARPGQVPIETTPDSWGSRSVPTW